MSSHSELLEQILKQQIGLFGPLSFSEFMKIVLYHPMYGYYQQSTTQRGRQGDYVTSLQVSPLFSEIFANVIWELKETLSTDQFSLVEMGSGNGEFLYGVLNTLSRQNRLRGIQVWAVEAGRGNREKLQRLLSRFPKCHVVSSLDEIEWMGSLEGCVFSNEFFDALPFHRLKWDGRTWGEIYLNHEQGQWVEVLGEVSNEAQGIHALMSRQKLAPGAEIEYRPHIKDLYAEWSQLFIRGYVLSIDYGQPRHLLWDTSRPQGTWRCFYKHQMNTRPWDRLGEQDITSNIDFTQLAEEGEANEFNTLQFSSQGLFLTHAGKELIEKKLTSGSDEEKKGLQGALQQLLHPHMMGEKFWVLLQGKQAELPPLIQSIPNRKQRLAAWPLGDKFLT